VMVIAQVFKRYFIFQIQPFTVHHSWLSIQREVTMR
jgi:hypothetical protein